MTDTIDEIKQEIRDKIVWDVPIKYHAGGQTVGRFDSTVILICEDLSIRLEIGYHRSQIQNRDTAKLLFELLFSIDTKFI